jgi:hypothetical protein
MTLSPAQLPSTCVESGDAERRRRRRREQFSHKSHDRRGYETATTTSQPRPSPTRRATRPIVPGHGARPAVREYV